MIVGKLMLGERISISELMNSAEYEYARNNLERHMSEGSKFCSPIISISLFQNPISLAEAKQLSSDFCVPQSFIYTSKYSKLSEELEARKADTYNINSSKSLEMLGLFSYEIIEKFPIKIALPDYLGKYKAFEKCDFYRLE